MEDTDSRTLRAYLLGQLAAERQQSLEARLLEDGELRTLAEAAQQDLYEAFAAGRLNPAEREAWQQYMSKHPDDARRLRTAHVLRRKSATSSAPGTLPLSVSPRWIALAAALAAALLVAFFYFTPKPKPVYYVSASFEPGAVRPSQGDASSIQWLDLPAEATGAQIELRRAPTQARQAELRHVSSGQVIWRGPLTLGVVLIPAAVFDKDGDYLLTLAEAPGTDVADYSFRLRKSVP